jgi:hypothetical protein
MRLFQRLERHLGGMRRLRHLQCLRRIPELAQMQRALTLIGRNFGGTADQTRSPFFVEDQRWPGKRLVTRVLPTRLGSTAR